MCPLDILLSPGAYQRGARVARCIRREPITPGVGGARPWNLESVRGGARRATSVVITTTINTVFGAEDDGAKNRHRILNLTRWERHFSVAPGVAKLPTLLSVTMMRFECAGQAALSSMSRLIRGQRTSRADGGRLGGPPSSAACLRWRSGCGLSYSGRCGRQARRLHEAANPDVVSDRTAMPADDRIALDQMPMLLTGIPRLGRGHRDHHSAHGQSACGVFDSSKGGRRRRY